MILPQNRKAIPQADIVCGTFNTEFKSPALQCQKENVLKQIKEIENKLKFSINAEKNLRETRAIATIKKNPKYFYKFVNNNSTIGA